MRADTQLPKRGAVLTVSLPPTAPQLGCRMNTTTRQTATGTDLRPCRAAAALLGRDCGYNKARLRRDGGITLCHGNLDAETVTARHQKGGGGQVNLEH